MMKSLRSLGCIVILFGLLASLGAQTDNSPHRIAVIDVQRVLTESNAGKAAYAKLKKIQDDRIATAQAMDAEITALAKSATKDEKKLAEKRAALQLFSKQA